MSKKLTRGDARLNIHPGEWYFGNEYESLYTVLGSCVALSLWHPKLKIDYDYDDAAGKAMVIIEQTQKTDKVFKLPIAIDIYNGAAKKRYNVWVENKIDTFTFNYATHPDLINVDADKVMLWQKTDNKTAENFIAQYKYAPLFLDRREALDYFAKKKMKELAEGLKDKYGPLREFTLNKLAESTAAPDASVLQATEQLIAKEKNKKAKAAAINLLVKTGDAKYLPVYKANINDSSYSVAGAALNGLASLEPENAYTLAKKYSSDAKGDLGTAVDGIIIENGTEADFDFIATRFDKAPLSQSKFESLEGFCNFLGKVKNLDNVKKGIDMVVKFRNAIPESFRGFTDPAINASLKKVSAAKGKEIEDYINEKLK